MADKVTRREFVRNTAAAAVTGGLLSNRIVYAGNPSGVFRSADSGQTWEQIDTGLSNTEVKCLTVSSAEPVTVYAGTADGKLFAYVEE